MRISRVFLYDSIFNVPESYDIDMQVMHESTMMLYIFRNGSINKVLAGGTVEKGLDSLEVKRIGEGRDTKYTFAPV